MTAALVTAAFGLVLLVLLIVTALAHVRRFTRASIALRSGIGPRVAALQAVVGSRLNSRRRGAE